MEVWSVITDEDIQMSKMSYVNKDFGTIYPLLLDLAKLLSSKWDPSTSNESDPGVVLLKEGAFIADHTNYNIDKNILEAFLPSATLDESVSNLVSMNGYVPRYYVSALGDVTFTYVADDDEEFEAFNIPAFTLLVSDDDESLVYTQTSALSISANKAASTCTFIEGSINTLTVDNGTTITLENLDSQNRIYFPVKYVALNGVYVANVDSPNDFWEKKDYLLASHLHSTIFKVGYDATKQLPYVEFPTDIATLIGSGLVIKYITSTGINGNVNSDVLTKIVSSTTYTTDSGTEIDLSKLTLSNYSSISNGKDPETIDEMYESFKKVVGTFDTLVTRQDYLDALSELTDSLTADKLLSNCAVTDINTDYNHSIRLTSYDQYGAYTSNAALQTGISTYTFRSSQPSSPVPGDVYYNSSTSKFMYYDNNSSWQELTTLSYDLFVTAAEAISPFDLYVYALRAYNSNEFSSVKYSLALRNSYKPADLTIIDTAESLIQEYKCINHKYLHAKVGDVLFFKNYCPLQVTITPYSKVTKKERDSIITSVQKAISDNFNASKLEFGTELSYDDVVQVLLNADDRIKNIRLEDIQYQAKAVIKTDTGYEEASVFNNDNDSSYTTDVLVDLLAKNILAGRLCLFEFEEEFKPSYGLKVNTTTEDTVITDVSSITAETEIPTDNNIGSSTEETKETTYNFTSSTSQLIRVSISGSTTVDVPAGESVTIDDGRFITVYYNFSSSSLLYANNAVYTSVSGSLAYVINNTTSANITINTGSGTILSSNSDITITKRTTTTAASNTTTISSIGDNEYIHIAYQSYSTDSIFPTYVNYRFESLNSEDVIPANTDYRLQAGQNLYMYYTSSGADLTNLYGAGDVIKSSFDISVTTTGNNKTWTDQYTGVQRTAAFNTLSSNQQIEHRVLMQTTLNGSSTPCYWIRNTTNNSLFTDFTTPNYYTTILGAGEYFIYSNQNKNILVILGSGTKLTGYCYTAEDWLIQDEDISITGIEENGFESGLTWLNKDFSVYNFIINEQTLVTLGKGDSLEIYNWTNPPESINNTWVTCDGYIVYTLSDGTSTTLPSLQDGYQIRSRLDLAMGPDEGLQLSNNQTITITDQDGDQTDLTNCTIKSSESINTYGDTELNISKILGTTETISVQSYDEAYCYVTTTSSGTSKLEIVTPTSGRISVVVNQDLSTLFPFFYRNVDTSTDYILPVFVYGDKGIPSGVTLTFSVKDSSDAYVGIREYNSGNAFTSGALTLSDSCMYLIEVNQPSTEITNMQSVFTSSATDTSSYAESSIAVTFFNPVQTYGLNKKLAYSGVTLDAVLALMKSLVSKSLVSGLKPYYINEPDSSIAIENEDITSNDTNSNIFWDTNNVANAITIPYIDLDSGATNIDIMKSMRNYT